MRMFANAVFLVVSFCTVASSFSATIHVPSQQPTIQTGNLALLKPTFAPTYHNEEKNPDMAVDGNTTTFWSSGAPSPTWWTVDLLDSYAVDSLTIRIRGDENPLCYGAPCYRFTIEGSIDSTNWDTLVVEDWTYNAKYKYQLDKRSLRYLKVSFQDSSDWAQWVNIVEFEAFGSQVIPNVTAVGMENEALSNVLSLAPKIQWAVSQPVPSPQDSFIIAVGTDTDWQFAEKWNPAPFASSDTFVTYDGSALLDGQTYYLRLRMHNTLAWSDWYQTSFRMNSVPASPILRAPTNLAVVGSTPTLWVTNGTDAESDPLTYEFAGFHDTDCVAGPAINLVGVASGVDSTGGQIVDPLAENCRYWWRARVFDGYEYSPWTAYAQFMVNGQPEAPAAPMLDYPPLPDNKPIFILLPTLTWQASYDADPGDTVRYKLELSDRANFSFGLVRDSLLNTNLSLTDSLEFGKHYWWRVTAKDKTGLSAMSSVKEFWTWKLGDMNHSHGVDLSDLSLLIAYLTQTPRPGVSPKLIADLTGDCKIDLSDLSLMVAYLTTGGEEFEVGCE